MPLPIAVAGDDVVRSYAFLSQVVTLDGAASFDPGGAPIDAYDWVLLWRPNASSAVLVDAETATPSITPDVPGTYRIMLRVKAGDRWSEGNLLQAPDSAFIQVVITTQHRTLRLPAEGERGWTDHTNAWGTALDALAGSFDTHGSRHAATGADPLQTAAPSANAVKAGTATPAVGSSASYARADHVHQVDTAAPAATAVRPGNSTPAVGTSETFARADHVHQVDTAAPAAVSSAQAENAVGSSAAFARADHQHAFSAVRGTEAERPALTGSGPVHVTVGDGGERTLQRLEADSWEDVAPSTNHDHDGAGGGAQVDHSNLTGVSTDQHHAKLHNTSHAFGGTDALKTALNHVTINFTTVRLVETFVDVQADGFQIHSEPAPGGGTVPPTSQPAHPRTLKVFANDWDGTGLQVTISGLLANGEEASETVTLGAAGVKVETAKAFAYIESIAYPAITAGKTVDMELTSRFGVSNPLSVSLDRVVYKTAVNGIHFDVTDVDLDKPNATVLLAYPVSINDSVTVWYKQSHGHSTVAHRHEMETA